MPPSMPDDARDPQFSRLARLFSPTPPAVLQVAGVRGVLDNARMAFGIATGGQLSDNPQNEFSVDPTASGHS